jgi:hypothetical protein
VTSIVSRAESGARGRTQGTHSDWRLLDRRRGHVAERFSRNRQAHARGASSQKLAPRFKGFAAPLLAAKGAASLLILARVARGAASPLRLASADSYASTRASNKNGSCFVPVATLGSHCVRRSRSPHAGPHLDGPKRVGDPLPNRQKSLNIPCGTDRHCRH